MIKTKLLATLLLVLLSGGAFAQADPGMIDNLMLQSGKIYFVVAVIAVIFAVVIIYLIRLDRKVSELEESVKEN